MNKPRVEKKIKLLLAIKGRADNARLLEALKSFSYFSISLENPRTTKDSIKCLEKNKYELFICDHAFINQRTLEILKSLKQTHTDLPVILLAHKDGDTTNQHAIAINAVHTLIIDLLDDNALAQHLNFSLNYAVLNTQYINHRRDTSLANSLAGAYAYRSSVTADNKMHSEWLSESFEEITGYSVAEVGQKGGWISFINKEDIPIVEDAVKKLLNNEETTFYYRATVKPGKTIWLESHGRPEWNDREKRVMSISGVTINITRRKQVELELQNKVDQQAAIATLGQFSMTDPSLKELFNRAVELITQTMHSELCEIFAISGETDQMILRSAYGVDPKEIDKLTLPLSKSNELNFVFSQKDIVLMPNLRKEERFKTSPHLRKEKAASGICAPINSGSEIIGTIGVYSKTEDHFKEDHLNFIKAIANILSSITAQESTEIRLKKTLKMLEHTDDSETSDIDADGFLFGPTPENAKDHINAIVQTALELRARDLIMSAIAKATRELFQAANWRDPIPKMLEELGKATEASRAYLFENNYGNDGKLSSQLQFEWLDQNIKPKHPKTEAYQLDLKKSGLGRFIDILSSGEYIAEHIQDLSEHEQIFLKKQDIASLLIVPIFVEHRWWGFLGFDVCHQQHDWTNAEIDALGISANMLGTAIERDQSDNAFKAIIQATAGKSGEDFFRYLVKHLALGMQADYCLIAENSEADLCKVHAIWEVNDFGEPWEFDPANTPCAALGKDEILYIAQDVSKQFSKFTWLTKKKIQSYTGIAVTSATGNGLGHIAVLHTQTLNISERDKEILKVFAARAGMEIERLHIERENELLASIPLDSIHLIMTANLQGEIIFRNPVCDKLTQDLNLKSIEDLLPENHQSHIQQTIQTPDELILAERSVGDFTFQWYYHHPQQMEHVSLYATDITQRHKLEEQLRQDAFHDPLTGLPNRAFFNKLLAHAIERTVRRNDYQFAVLFLDLDRFKIINDSLGHAYGDLLLQMVASVLSDCLRPGDYVARFGGDEFAILLDAISDAREATTVAERIQQKLSKPFMLDQNETFTSASIGIAISEIGYQKAEDILRDADIAMYSAKQRGKATHVIFDKHMHDEFVHVLKLETDLRNAIKNGELRVHYQPIYSISERKIVGFEALVRWQHPERGLLDPHSFVPTAEEMGLIRDIDRWVLEVSARQLKDWRDEFKHSRDLKMSINLSAIHFNQMDILAHIGNLLKDTKLPPNSLKLELTESVIMKTSNLSSEIFSVLNQRGMHIIIDDFGVGYSSLNRLIKLPVDTLKIDRSFVSSIIVDSNSLNVTRAIIDLAHNLDMEVIAEGVESEGQFQILGRLGCHYVQGYFISKPMNADDATLFLENPREF